MEQLQNTWNIVHENFMVLYDVFVAFVGLKNNYSQHRIWIGLVWPIPDLQKMTGSEPIPIMSIIGSMHQTYHQTYRWVSDQCIKPNTKPTDLFQETNEHTTAKKVLSTCSEWDWMHWNIICDSINLNENSNMQKLIKHIIVLPRLK